jgi:hypothetical protein
MSVGDRSRPAAPSRDDAVWSRVVTAVATIALVLTGVYLWARLALPPILDWAFQSRANSPAVTLTGWAMVSAPLLLVSVIQLRKGLLERAGRRVGTVERRATRAVLGLSLVTLLPLLPGRGPASRRGWAQVVLGHGHTFERAVTWSLFGGMAVYAAGAVIVMRKFDRASTLGLHLVWAALAAIAATLPLLALIVRLATLA